MKKKKSKEEKEEEQVRTEIAPEPSLRHVPLEWALVFRTLVRGSFLPGALGPFGDLEANQVSS